MSAWGNRGTLLAGVVVGVSLGAWSLASAGCGCPAANDPVGVFAFGDEPDPNAALDERIVGTVSISDEEMVIEYTEDGQRDYVVRYQRKPRE